MKRGVGSALVLLAACGARSTLLETRYPDGQPHEEYAMRDGVRHGPGRTWHANRTLASSGNYVLGKREGRFVFYSEDGSLEYQALFNHDEEVWRSTDPNA